MRVQSLFSINILPAIAITLLNHLNEVSCTINNNISRCLKEHEYESYLQNLKLQVLRRERFASHIEIFNAKVKCP